MSPRRRQRGATRRQAPAVGVLVLAAIAAISYLVFVGVPFGRPFTVRAVFASAGALKAGSPVRIGGIDVGRVASVRLGPHATAIVAMEIDRDASRLRSDASAADLPRLALGGNDYVALSPGTPGASPLRSGTAIPLSRTHTSVALDQVLDVFTFPARTALRSAVAQLSGGLGPAPGAPPTGSTPAEPTGARALKDAVSQLSGTLDDLSAVARAAEGTASGDLPRALGRTAQVTSQLSSQPASLSGLIVHSDRVLGTLAAQDRALAGTVVQLAELVRGAPAQLARIDRAFGPVRQFADALVPALERAPGALISTAGALVQLNRLVAPPALPRLLSALRPASLVLPELIVRLGQLVGRLEPVSVCVSHTVVPALDEQVPDGPLSTGRPAWQDMLHLGANLASFSNTFDGNGTAFRVGTQLSETGLVAQLPGLQPLYGMGNIVGVDPYELPSIDQLPDRPDAPCGSQAPPNLTVRRLSGLPPGLHRRALSSPSPAELDLLRALLSKNLNGIMDALGRLFPSLPAAARPADGVAWPRTAARRGRARTHGAAGPVRGPGGPGGLDASTPVPAGRQSTAPKAPQPSLLQLLSALGGSGGRR